MEGDDLSRYAAELELDADRVATALAEGTRRERIEEDLRAGQPPVVQIVGALLILAAFAAAQFGRLDQRSIVYLALNLVGSVILTILAWYEEQLGFLLLESVWALVSAWGLAQVLRRRQPLG